MGIEYYIVKPKKKEIFYLGKHFNGFNEIKNTTYNSLFEATFPNYDDWDDFFWDTLKENWDYFNGCELTLEQASNVIHDIYEWCVSDEVILDNDCSDSFNIWKNWEETGDICTILEKAHITKDNISNEIFESTLEENGSILFSNPSYNSALIGITTDGRAAYDYYLMIAELCSKDNMSYEEAVEFIEYNTIGSLPQSNTKYPIIINKKEDIV